MNVPGLQFDPPKFDPSPSLCLVSSKFAGIRDFHFASIIDCKIFSNRGEDKQIINDLFMFPPDNFRIGRKKVEKTFPLFQVRIMVEGKGGQLLAWQGEQGLIMRGAGMFFSLPSLLFTHKKGKAKKNIVLDILWTYLDMYDLVWLSLQLCGICV